MQTHLHILSKNFFKNTYRIFTIINSYQKQYRSPNSTAAPSAGNSLTGMWLNGLKNTPWSNKLWHKNSFPQPADSAVQTDTSVQVWGGVVSLSSVQSWGVKTAVFSQLWNPRVCDSICSSFTSVGGGVAVSGVHLSAARMRGPTEVQCLVYWWNAAAPGRPCPGQC